MVLCLVPETSIKMFFLLIVLLQSKCGGLISAHPASSGTPPQFLQGAPAPPGHTRATWLRRMGCENWHPQPQITLRVEPRKVGAPFGTSGFTWLEFLNWVRGEWNPRMVT